MEKYMAIPHYPTCPICGSRFYRADGDSNTLCPACRDTVGGTSLGSLEERLEVGFAMQSDDEIVLKNEDGTEPVE